MNHKQNQLALSSLALDLKRVALGYHRGSKTTAGRFLQEALLRKKDIDTHAVKPYVKTLLKKVDALATETDTGQIAEDALMLSTLLQNASRYV